MANFPKALTIKQLSNALKFNDELFVLADILTVPADANNVPTVCCFYVEENITGWAPDKNLYPRTILTLNNSPMCIYESCKKIIAFCGKF